MKTERDELAVAMVKATLAGPNCLEGHESLVKRCYALANAILAEGKQQPTPPGDGENDLTVPPGVVLFIRNRAEAYKAAGPAAGPGHISLRDLADELESLNAADLPEQPLCQRTLEAVAAYFNGLQGDYRSAEGCSVALHAKWAKEEVRGMAQEAKNDDV